MLIIRFFLFILSTLAIIPQVASREMLPQIWQREVIDKNSPDKNLLAMASDSAGNIYLAYVKTTNGPFTGNDTSLYLASNNKGYWRNKKIDGQRRIVNPKIYFDEGEWAELEIGAGSADAVSIILTPLKIYVGYFSEDGKNSSKLMLASKERHSI